MNKYNFRLTDEQVNQLSNEAKQRGVNISTMLRMILTDRYSNELPQKVSSTPTKKKAPKTSSNEGQRDWSNVVQSYWKGKKKA